MNKLTDMRYLITTIILLLTALPGAADYRSPLRTTAELRRVLAEGRQIGAKFSLEGAVERVPSSAHSGFTVVDDTGAVIAYRGRTIADRELKSGDRVALSGETAYYNDTRLHLCARVDGLKILSHGPPFPTRQLRCADFAGSEHDYRTVSVGGIVRSAFRDEIDPNFSVMVISDGDDTLSMFVRTNDGRRDLDGYIGAEVLATGLCSPRPTGSRLHLGRTLIIRSLDDVTILRRGEADIFNVPGLEQLRWKSPGDIRTVGRHRAIGRVVTRWLGDRRMIIAAESNVFVNVELAWATAPEPGRTVEVSGIPETDLFRVNLCQASWRPAEREIGLECPPLELRIPEIFSDNHGQRKIQTSYHGRTLVVQGTVRSFLEPHPGERRMVIEDGGHTLTTDISAVREPPELGELVQATGVCVIEADLSNTQSSFPRIREVLLVVNRPEDLRRLVAAPFWTPLRLATVIGALAAVLVGIVLWNLSLRTRVRAKTRELEQEIANTLDAELRLHERTRLATELHDTLSQNLTGVALALDAVSEVITPGNTEALDRMAIAARTLKSCRGELRNCLWDLRSEALEEGEIDDAIRRTLAPHIRDTEVAVRFRAVREAFSDNTMHTILCIIRELTVNAIRHGNAKNVKIAGSLENGELRFSVADDGCGFSPQERPGIESGHFGLQGVQERAEGLGGSMTISSRPGKGTKVTISIMVNPSKTDSDRICQR